jgi:hypothetical protein
VPLHFCADSFIWLTVCAQTLARCACRLLREPSFGCVAPLRPSNFSSRLVSPANKIRMWGSEIWCVKYIYIIYLMQYTTSEDAIVEGELIYSSLRLIVGIKQ